MVSPPAADSVAAATRSRWTIGASQDVRRHNLATVLWHVHVAGALRRAELTGRLGLNRSTIAALVAELVSLGLVREERHEGRPQVGAGRPSPMVLACRESVQVLAADVGVRRASVALVGLGGHVVARRHCPIDDPAPAAVAGQLAATVRDLLDASALGRHVVGFGVSVPGLVRREDGNVRFAPNLGWRDAPLGELLATNLPALRIRIGNDADLAALAEHVRGAARSVDDVVVILGQEGVGGGLILGGRPMLGAGGYAGELGHMIVSSGRRRCRCGAIGCWETEIGANAVARAMGVPGLASDDLRRRIAELPPGSGAILDDPARALGLGLATIANVLNPQLVILGGLLAEVFSVAQLSVRSAMNDAMLSAPREQVRVTVPALRSNAVLIGAAELAWQELLVDPAGVLAESGVRAST
jgi:predicted NBD/HSP70 family sugar kinase